MTSHNSYLSLSRSLAIKYMALIWLCAVRMCMLFYRHNWWTESAHLCVSMSLHAGALPFFRIFFYSSLNLWWLSDIIQLPQPLTAPIEIFHTNTNMNRKEQLNELRGCDQTRQTLYYMLLQRTMKMVMMMVGIRSVICKYSTDFPPQQTSHFDGNNNAQKWCYRIHSIHNGKCTACRA